MIPATTERVALHTADHVNDEIRRRTDENLAEISAQGPQAIAERIAELDHEWDIERTLEANAASVSLLGLGLAAFVDRRFLVLPAAVAGFLLQHAIQGWCPPISFFRRLGFRTQTEIEQERHALKALRGDYRHVPLDGHAGPRRSSQAMRAAQP